MKPPKVQRGIPPRPAKPGELVALDIETWRQGPRLHIPDGEFALLSVAMEDGVWVTDDLADALRALKRVAKGRWVGHNFLYDLRYFLQWGAVIPFPVHDTMVFEHTLFNGYFDNFALDDCVRRHFDVLLDKSTRDDFGGSPVPLEPRHYEYAGLDAWWTLQTAKKQLEVAEDFETKFYYDIEAPTIEVILNIKPIHVDRAAWMEMVEEFETKAVEITGRLKFNLNSWQQIQAEAGKLGLILPNTQTETLKQYENHKQAGAWVKDVLAYKAVAQNIKMYGREWIEKNLAGDNYVQAGWSVNNAETHRMTSEGPNLQQIPVRKEPRYRKTFIASKGDVILSVDAAQQEPRVLAFLSGDAEMMKALASGESLHLAMARTLFNRPITKEDKEYKIGKDINLGTGYGLTPEGLSQRTGLPLPEAERIIAMYFHRFPGIQRYIQNERIKAERNGYTRSVLKIKQWLNPYDYKSLNNAINGPVQMTAGHITKRAANIVLQETRARGLPFGMTMIVHDEFVFDIPKKLASVYEQIAREAWQQAAAEIIPGIPFASDSHIGPTWSEMDE